MNKFRIGTINSENVVIGDNNTINLSSQERKQKVWTNDDYLDFLKQVNNIDKTVIHQFYLENFECASKQNPKFDEILYRDLDFLLRDIGKENDGSNKVRNGDFVIEDGDFATEGVMTNLHYLQMFLHMKLVSYSKEKHAAQFNYLPKLEVIAEQSQTKYSASYRNSLDKLKTQVKIDYNNLNNRPTAKWTMKQAMESFEMNVNLGVVDFKVNSQLFKDAWKSLFK